MCRNLKLIFRIILYHFLINLILDHFLIYRKIMLWNWFSISYFYILWFCAENCSKSLWWVVVWWWWLRPTVVFSLRLDQAEQLPLRLYSLHWGNWLIYLGLNLWPCYPPKWYQWIPTNFYLLQISRYKLSSVIDLVINPVINLVIGPVISPVINLVIKLLSTWLIHKWFLCLAMMGFWSL